MNCFKGNGGAVEGDVEDDDAPDDEEGIGSDEDEHVAIL